MSEQKMSEPLKPCPFCGGPAITGFRGPGHAVRCADPKCEIQPGTIGHKALDAAITIWNRRAP